MMTGPLSPSGKGKELALEEERVDNPDYEREMIVSSFGDVRCWKAFKGGLFNYLLIWYPDNCRFIENKTRPENIDFSFSNFKIFG